MGEGFGTSDCGRSFDSAAGVERRTALVSMEARGPTQKIARMEVKNKATRIELFRLNTPQMRAFHMSWFAFFLCFFACSVSLP